LVILVGIAITSIKGNNGLLSKALLARNRYKNAKDNEVNILDSYEAKISEASRDGLGSSIHITIDGEEYFAAGVNTTRDGESIESTFNGDGISVPNSNGNINMNITIKKKVTNFDYTGGEQTYTVPVDGYYLLESWGAQGGNTIQKIGGYGGYSAGIVYLKSSTTLYINVGGKGLGDGTHTARKGGYNGGGDATSDGDGNTRQGSGGGATHIAMQTGLLSSLSNNIDSILIVAGGGGGASANAAIMPVSGGAGGGFKGTSGETYVEGSFICTGTGGTQTTGYLFGQGDNAIVAGAGGGYYGGNSTYYSAGGGSGYIGNPLLTSYKTYTKHMAGYNVATSDDDSTKTISTTNVSSTPTADYAKSGNGYARITFISY